MGTFFNVREFAAKKKIHVKAFFFVTILKRLHLVKVVKQVVFMKH